MNGPDRLILALDGHDGSGKTTLAKQLASAVGGLYLRPYGEPYGSELLRQAQGGNYDKVLQLGRLAVERVLQDVPSGGPLIFDRFWITLFTLVPERYHAQWAMRPPTAVCWADLPTTLARLIGRFADKNTEERGNQSEHVYYLERYRELAREHRCAFIPTHLHDEAHCLQQLIVWAKGVSLQPHMGSAGV